MRGLTSGMVRGGMMGRFGRAAKKKAGKSLVPHSQVASPIRYPHSEEGLTLIPVEQLALLDVVEVVQGPYSGGVAE